MISSAFSKNDLNRCEDPSSVIKENYACISRHKVSSISQAWIAPDIDLSSISKNQVISASQVDDILESFCLKDNFSEEDVFKLNFMLHPLGQVRFSHLFGFLGIITKDSVNFNASVKNCLQNPAIFKKAYQKIKRELIRNNKLDAFLAIAATCLHDVEEILALLKHGCDIFVELKNNAASPHAEKLRQRLHTFYLKLPQAIADLVFDDLLSYYNKSECISYPMEGILNLCVLAKEFPLKKMHFQEDEKEFIDTLMQKDMIRLQDIHTLNDMSIGCYLDLIESKQLDLLKSKIQDEETERALGELLTKFDFENRKSWVRERIHDDSLVIEEILSKIPPTIDEVNALMLLSPQQEIEFSIFCRRNSQMFMRFYYSLSEELRAFFLCNFFQKPFLSGDYPVIDWANEALKDKFDVAAIAPRVEIACIIAQEFIIDDSVKNQMLLMELIQAMPLGEMLTSFFCESTRFNADEKVLSLLPHLLDRKRIACAVNGLLKSEWKAVHNNNARSSDIFWRNWHQDFTRRDLSYVIDIVQMITENVPTPLTIEFDYNLPAEQAEGLTFNAAFKPEIFNVTDNPNGIAYSWIYAVFTHGSLSQEGKAAAMSCLYHSSVFRNYRPAPPWLYKLQNNIPDCIVRSIPSFESFLKNKENNANDIQHHLLEFALTGKSDLLFENLIVFLPFLENNSLEAQFFSESLLRWGSGLRSFPEILENRDLILKVSCDNGEEKVLASKAICVVGSDYFKAMLEGEWKESKEQEIVIEQISFPVLEYIVNYMLFGIDLLDGKDSAFLVDLWSGANLLQIDEIMEACLTRLKNSIKELPVDEIREIFNFAELAGDENLIKACLSKIIS